MLKQLAKLFERPDEHSVIKNDSKNNNKTIESVSLQKGDLLINDETFQIRKIRSIIMEAPDFNEHQKLDGKRDVFIYMPRKRKNHEWAGGMVSQAFYLGTLEASENVATYLKTTVRTAGIPVLEI